MINNSVDKGQLMVKLKELGDDLYVSEIGLEANSTDLSFYVYYEDGTLYVDWKDGSPKTIIGYYETVATTPFGAKVFDDTQTILLGWVGNEMIYFRSLNGQSSNCLAYYSKSGRIMPINNMLGTVGLIDGSEIGGAAAFIATFFRYNFKSVYRDYLEMDDATFKKAYASYLNSFGI